MSHVISQLPGSHPDSDPYLPREQPEAAQEQFLESEISFYQGYGWCLNPFPTVRETIEHLGVEINRLRERQEAWQAGEVATNVFLLSCALLNSLDEYLRGTSLRLPKQLAEVPLARVAGRATENLAAVLRQSSRRRARRWRERLQAHLKCRVAQGEFVILLPKVGFKNLCRRQKPQNSDVATSNAAAISIRHGRSTAGQPSADWQQNSPQTDVLKE